MASDGPPEYSPVPATTFNLKEKIKVIFLEEAKFLYTTFLTVHSVTLKGTLSISINGNEDNGVIEVAESTERVPGSDTFSYPQYDGSEKNVSGISKMAKPLPLPNIPKMFDKSLFDKVTSLGQLEIMKQNLIQKSTNEIDGTRSNFSEIKEEVTEKPKKPKKTKLPEVPDDDVDDYEDFSDDTVNEENDDKKDEDYSPEIGDDKDVVEDFESDGGKVEIPENSNSEPKQPRRNSLKRKISSLKRKISKHLTPKKRGRKTAAKLSLKIKMNKLTPIKRKTIKKVKDERKIIPDNLFCELCQKKFDTRRAYRRHNDKHFKTFQCDECGKSFSSMDSLTHHKRGLHSDTKPYSCEECGMEFNFHHSYKLHMRKHSGLRPYKCDQCDKTYLTSTHLKSHKEAIHDSENKNQFVCDTCGKTFTYRNSLKTHQMIHSGERPFKCSICEKGFVTKQALKTHEDSYHTEEKNFQCDICYKYYKSEHLRNVHRRRHTTDVNRFMCDICGRQFMFKSNLEAHSYVHQDDRPFVCTVCHKAFKCQSSLYTHLYTHKTTTPFECSVCNKTFKTKNCCKAHEKRHTAGKNYMCSTCGSCFPDKGGLTKHMRTIHSPVKQYVCKFCGKVGTRADNMRTHIKSHGKEIGNQDISDCIIEMKATGETAAELANKYSDGTRQRKPKSNQTTPKPSLPLPPQHQQPQQRPPFHPQATSTTTSLPDSVLESSVLYPTSNMPNQNYESHMPQMTAYQDTYQPPLSPRNYPRPLSPSRHSPMTHGVIPPGVTISNSIGHVGPGQMMHSLLNVTDPSHLNLIGQQMPLPAHMQSSDHGPPIFPPHHPMDAQINKNM